MNEYPTSSITFYCPSKSCLLLFLLDSCTLSTHTASTKLSQISTVQKIRAMTYEQSQQQHRSKNSVTDYRQETYRRTVTLCQTTSNAQKRERNMPLHVKMAPPTKRNFLNNVENNLILVSDVTSFIPL